MSSNRTPLPVHLVDRFFDPDWYRGRYPEVDRTGSDPRAYYLEHGNAAGHAPNAFADPSRPWALSRRLASYRWLLEKARTEFPKPDASNEILFAYLDRLSAVSPCGSHSIPSVDSSEPQVSIIIPTYNQPFYTLACVYSVLTARTRTPFEIIVADDASDVEGCVDASLADILNVRCNRQSSNLGFLRNCNDATSSARGEFVLFLNNDTLVADGWLDELVATFERFPDVGIAGSKLLFPSGQVAEAGGLVWRDASAWNFGRHREADDPEVVYAREADYVSGASLLIRKELFDELGGFDEAYAPAYFEDTDLAFRVRQAGRRVLYQPNSEVIHLEGLSSGTDIRRGIKRYQDINQTTFASRWRTAVAHHGERGTEPEREKDRRTPRTALVLDVCLPSPQRDARSRRLFNMIKILRNDGFKIRFVAESFDADETFLRELRGNGIEVPSVTDVETFIVDEAPSCDVCLLARPAIADRWANLIEACAPEVRIVTDLSDLWREQEIVSAQFDRGGRSRLIADLGAASNDLAMARDATNLPHIHEPVRTITATARRRRVWVATGFQDDVTADSLLWLRDEIIPRLEALAHRDEPLDFYLRRRSYSDLITTGCETLHPIDEEDLTAENALDSFRIAVAPTRFGAGIASQIEAALARGIPCVATSHAVSGMARDLADVVTIADTADAIAQAVLALYDDEPGWGDAARAALERTRAHYPYGEAVRTVLSFVS